MHNSNEVSVNQKDEYIEIFIPMKLKRFGGKKTIIAPNARPVNSDRHPSHDLVLLQALLKAHMWNDMLLKGVYPSVSQLSIGEELAEGYASPILRLALLAPDIQEAILFATFPSHLTLADFKQPFPELWDQQRKYFGIG